MPRPTDNTNSPAHPPSSQGPVLVTGGTGTLGRPLVETLLADGVPVRVMSRRPRTEGDERPYEWAVCDLKKGVGLAAAVAGVRAIVHCATDPFREAAVLARLVEAAREAGGPHLVYISIVGVDTIPFSYYRGKRDAERVLEESGLPWTVLRATQFHNLIESITNAQRRLPLVFAPSGVRFQPIEVSEVAARLAELVRGAPAGRVPDIAGPEVRTARDLADATLAAHGRRRRVVGLRVPGGMGRTFRQGANLAPDRAVGTVTFNDFLAERAAPAAG